VRLVMAENKKSFLIYCDLLHTIKKMSKEDAGELFLHILEYTNDLNPTTENIIVELVFEPIKQQLKRDLKSYEKSIEDKSLNGRIGNLKRWNNDLFIKYEAKKITLDEAESIAKSRKASQPDSSAIKPIANIAVTDTVNVTVNDTVKDIKEINIPALPVFSFYHSLINLGYKKELVSDWIKVRKNKRLTNTETAFNKFIKQVEKSGYSGNEILEKCIEKSWGGFDSEWHSKNKNKTSESDTFINSNGYKIQKGVL